jgi:hypothetical protein
MTIGPLPMISIDWMDVSFGIAWTLKVQFRNVFNKLRTNLSKSSEAK